MPQNTAGVTATSNTSAGTQDLFIEIKAPSSGQFFVKRVRVSLGNAAETTGQDGDYFVQLYRYTTTTAGSATSLSFPAASALSSHAANFWIGRNPNNVNSVVTIKVKNGTTALAIGSGTVQILDEISVNGRAVYEFLARDDDDMWSPPTSGCFAVALICSVASQVFNVTVDWEE